MKVLFMTGTYGCLGTQDTGSVLFVNFEHGDDLATIERALKKCKKMKVAKLILVPFAHLSERYIEKQKAKELFSFLSSHAQARFGEVITHGFDTEKDLVLQVPIDGTIKLLSF